MPETVGAAIVTAIEGVFFAGEWVFTASQIAAIGNAAIVVATSAYSVNQRRKAAAAARAAYNASLRDRNISLRGTLQPRELVLGKVRKGGTIVFAGTTGSNSEKLTMVIVMAGHSVAGFDTYYLDETPVTVDGSGYVTTSPWAKTRKVAGSKAITLSAGAGSVVLDHTPVSGSVNVVVDLGTANGTVSTTPTSVVGSTVTVSGWSSVTGTGVVHYTHEETDYRVRIRSMLGSSTQSAFADLVTQFPADWTSNHRLRGCAYLVVELDYDPDVFPAGIPNVSALMRGADTVEDPRDSSTGYTENPALLLRHYLLHELGGRRSAAQIDDASVIAAANVCETQVDYGDGNVDLYTAGTVASTEQAPRDVCDELAEAMAGRWGYSGGLIRMRAGALGTTVAAITADWLAQGPITVQPARPRAELRNIIAGSFVDPASNYNLVQFPRVEDSTAVSDDGAELVGEVEFGAINRAGQAQQVAAVMLREDRQALVVTLQCNMRAYALQLFDVVTVTLDRFGWSSKKFEVLDRRFALGGAIQLTLKETDSSIYSFGTSFASTDPAPNTNLPAPWTVEVPGAITVTSGSGALLDGTPVSRVYLSWASLSDAGVLQGGYIEIGYVDAAANSGEQVVRADTLTSHTLNGLRNGYHYLFRARGVNGSGVRSNWGPATLHQMAGTRGTITYRQASAPSGTLMQQGDLWFDSDDGDKPYRYSGSAWVSIQDGGIAAALAAAADAQATADGKVATYWQATAPGTADEGDIWFDTDDGYKQYRYTSGVWTVAADTRIGQAITAASDAQATADGKVVTFVASSAPTAEAVGDLWLDTANGNALYRWSGSAWVAYALGTDALAPDAATDVVELYSTYDGVTYGTGLNVVVGASIESPVDARVVVTATFDASGLTGFESTRWAALVQVDMADVTVGTESDYSDASFSAVDGTFSEAATVATTRTKVSLTKTFDAVANTEYLFALATSNSVSMTNGLTFYGKQLLQVQVIKR